MTRVQVLVPEEEREAFRREAQKEGRSLSAWLREAGRAKLASTKTKRMSLEELKAFFAASDAREQGREPDWEDHLKVIEASMRSGATDT